VRRRKMRRLLGAVVLALSLCGCDPVPSSTWKSKYLKEIELHYQTQQIKNAEIAARDMEVENQRQFMAILTDRIEHLEKENQKLRGGRDKELYARRASAGGLRRSASAKSPRSRERSGLRCSASARNKG
jgi:hypothetical protein